MANVPVGRFPGIPADAFTAQFTPGLRRLQVDVGQTGFFAGREFRSFLEYTIPAAGQVVVKVVVPPTLRGIIVQRLVVSCHQGGTLCRAWRDGTEAGVFTALPVIPNNGIPDVTPAAALTTLSSGGTLSGMTIKTDAVVALANNSGPSNTTVINAIEKERGLPAGTYYIELTRVTGTTVDALGVINALWEERPLDEETWVGGP